MKEYCLCAQKSIDYIEDHLCDDLSLEDIASQSGFSLKHLYRIFPRLTGMTIKEYVRFRRLSKAALDIRDGNEKILDVSIRYGYSSQEAFSRAFKELFSIFPGQYRHSGMPIPLISKINLVKELSHQEPSKKEDSETGVETYYIEKPARKIIAKFNQHAVPDPQEVINFYNIQSSAFGMLDSIKEVLSIFGGFIFAPTFRHFIGGEVETGYHGAIPTGFDLFVISRMKYVVFWHPSYPQEKHHEVVSQVWTASNQWKPEKYGMSFANANIPVFEEDNEDLGFFVYKPVIDRSNDQNAMP